MAGRDATYSNLHMSEVQNLDLKARYEDCFTSELVSSDSGIASVCRLYRKKKLIREMLLNVAPTAVLEPHPQSYQLAHPA